MTQASCRCYSSSGSDSDYQSAVSKPSGPKAKKKDKKKKSSKKDSGSDSDSDSSCTFSIFFEHVRIF